MQAFSEPMESYNADRPSPMEKLKIVLKLPEAAGILPVHSGSLSKNFQKVKVGCLLICQARLLPKWTSLDLTSVTRSSLT